MPTIRRSRSERSWRRTTHDATVILAAEGVSKSFGALVVLDQIHFAVGADEAVGIVGPNGAGKTKIGRAHV